MRARKPNMRTIQPNILWDLESGHMTQDVAEYLLELPEIPEALLFDSEFGMSPELYDFVRSVLDGS